MTISKAECEDRRLDRLASLNLTAGVWVAECGGFIGLREKFGAVYAFMEYHVDDGPPFGTAAPLAAIDAVAPDDLLLVEYLEGTTCTECDAPSEYVKWPDGERPVELASGYVMLAPGQWQHVDGTRCEHMGGCLRPNVALEAWLRAKVRGRAKPLAESAALSAKYPPSGSSHADR